MMTVLTLITLLSLSMPFYVYGGYPLVLWVLTRFTKTEIEHQIKKLPSVTLIISCYNEAGVIARKLENSLALDYPKDLLTIKAVSDGSNDGTDNIVKGFADRGINLIRQEGRLGKTMGLNLAMEQVHSDVVIFSDANAIYAPDSIKHLVNPFADNNVGYVVGAALYTDGTESASAQNENLYWRYELAIKAWESQLHSVVGGDGAIYAIRRTLWEPLQQRDINDFVNPLQIIAKGYRGRFEPRAKCFEETAGSFDKEIARKERIVNRSIRGLMRVSSVMNPLKTGLFSFMVISHKLLRWLIPFFLLIGLIGSSILASQSWLLFQFVTAGSISFTLLACFGLIMQSNPKIPVIVSLPYYFIMVNGYALKGIARALKGNTQVIWSSTRPENKAAGSGEPPKFRLVIFFSTALIAMAVSLIWPYLSLVG